MSEVTSVNGKTGAVVLTASNVEAVPTSEVGQPSGVASLNGSGVLPESELPSSVVSDGQAGAGALTATATRTSTIAAPTLRDFVSVNDYGPVAGSLKYSLIGGGEAELGDGSGTTLASVYSTLAAAQAKYPAATALTQTVDWAAVQTAGTAAIAATAQLVWPCPSSAWIINSTISWEPSSGTYFRLDIDARGYNVIHYTGANNTSVFHTYGMRFSVWRGVTVRINTSSTDIVVFDDDVNAGHTFNGPNTYYDAAITSEGKCTGCVGFRYSHDENKHATGSDGMTHHRITVSWGSESTGCIGYISEGSNALVFRWFSCTTSQCAVGVTNKSTAGAGSIQGGDSMFFYDCEGTLTEVDFEFVTAGIYGWFGGRWEEGSTFLKVPEGDSTINFTLPIVGVKWSGYKTLSGGELISVLASAQLSLVGCQLNVPANAIGSSMITVGTRGFGHLSVTGCTFANTDPFYTNKEGFTVEAVGNSKLEGASTTTYFANVVPLITAVASEVSKLTAEVGGLSASYIANPLKPSAAKFETISRTSAVTNQALLTSGRLLVAGIWLPAATLIEHLAWVSGNQAAEEPEHYWFCLLNSTLEALAFSADQTTAAWAATKLKSLAIATVASGAATSFTTTYTGLHYLGIMVVAKKAVPSVTGATTSSQIINLEPVICGNSTEKLTTVPTFPFKGAALSSSAACAYGYVG